MTILQSASNVLRLMAGKGRPLTVSEVADGLALPKSSTSRLLKQMLECDLLERDRVTLSYGPALLMLELGRLVQASTPILQRMEQELEALVQATGHTGYISVLDETKHSVVVLRVFHGRHALRVVTDPGQRGIASRTSTGHALLARLDDSVIDAAFGGEPAADDGPGAPSLAQLKRRLQRVRRRGWASALNESLPDVGSVSCAVGSPASGETWAFCLSFPAALAEQQGFLEGLAEPLVQSARALGQAAGDPAWQAAAPAVSPSVD
ncbi:IclR family transcriptional regulator [Variovorax ginsengisoli]|jgi:DNA-binding IclR family transcriptional regulator|uniref:Helix-turn-helix domain-containing protein n=1 Tax=Variovorax ginsengisoli TaxID=363844 RepID=A0ABT8S2Y5_9BURK|nr:helix-turn-helix domain-containing protein [Variovorax ginsengisoli]MDN8613157.1 helix-turn-helix domain-containing protein [Variovorax ginsengisoli]MDO1532327.1 helix-turn-helix domain-containing protein [Variovorax ginsengisoli]